MAKPWCAAFLPLALAALISCSGDGPAPAKLRLAELVRFADRYDGEVVATTGVVQMFDQPEHYWIEDDDLNRVRIRPQSAVSGHVGQRIRVVGRFEYAAETGRLIEARTVTPVD